MDYSKLETIKATIGGNSYNLLVAKSEEEKEYGLMGVKEIAENEGMLFCYKDDPQDELSYWMKDTEIPLDIIFVSDDMEVLEVFKGEPNSEELLTCTAPEGTKIVSVIEINQNSGVKPGDEVDIEDGETFDFPENGMFVLNSDGSIQFPLEGGERIMSRIFSRRLIHLCKKAKSLQTDVAYKAVGRALFKELTAQDERTPEYVNSPK